MNIWFQRIRDSIFPPKYPDYEEYRSEDEDTLAAAGGSSDGMDEKIIRLRLAAGFVVVMSVGVAAYLYTQDKDARERAGLKAPIAAEMLAEILPEEQMAKPDGLNDIRLWAQRMEAEAERTLGDSGSAALDTYTRNRVRSYGNPTGLSPLLSGDVRSGPSISTEELITSPSTTSVTARAQMDAADYISSVEAQAALRRDTHGSTAMTGRASPSAPPPSRSTSSDLTSPAASRSVASAPGVAVDAAANSALAASPPSIPPIVHQERPTTADTRTSRYTPKRYEPVTWERRELEPY